MTSEFRFKLTTTNDKKRQNFVSASKKLQLDLIIIKCRPQYLSNLNSRLTIKLRIIDYFFIQIKSFSLRLQQRVFERSHLINVYVGLKVD